MQQTERPRALVDWPNEASIIARVIQLIGDRAQEEAGEDDQDRYCHEPSTPNAGKMATLAPALSWLINLAMDDYDLPETVMESLDFEQDYIAEKALKELPREQVESIRDHCFPERED